MLIIGLTGSIGSGKTTVSDEFAKLGVPIIDTDLIARQLVEPGQPLLQRIARKFGQHYLNPEGGLDRRAVRELIFSDPQAKQELESIMHPAIQIEAKKQLQRLHADYVILVIPLLIESNEAYPLDRILVVDATESLQLERVMQRDGISKASAKKILSSQATKTQRLHLADDTIINNTDLPALHAAVNELHEKYLQLARC